MALPAVDFRPVVATSTTTDLNATGLTASGQKLKALGERTAAIPMGAARAAAFGTEVFPLLLDDAAKIVGPKVRDFDFSRAIAGAGSTDPTLGLSNPEKADNDYPPRAANALWNDFAATLGIAKEDAAAVSEINTRIGAFPKAEGKHAPAYESLTPDLQALATKVSRSLLGDDVGPLTSVETAFKANLVLNNLMWHMTNFQRAAGDATRRDPLQRENVFNTYSDNLGYAAQRGGLPTVVDMAISDSYNAGKPGVGAAKLQAVPEVVTVFEARPTTPPPSVLQLKGERTAAEQARVPQRDVY